MRTLLLTATVLLMCPAFMNAQGFLDKVKSFAGEADQLGKMEGSRYTIDGNGSITLPDGTVEEGTIQFYVTADNSDMKFFYFTPANEMKPKKVKSGEVEHFTVKGKDFYPIRLKEDDISIGNSRIFMEMLNAAPSDKFRMFQLRKLERNTSNIGNNPYDLKRGFYVMLPDFKNAHEIVDFTFTPFAKKMSEYLKDCPDLSKKIADKEKGYKVNMFNGAANDEIYLRIMNEYNSCGK